MDTAVSESDLLQHGIRKGMLRRRAALGLLDELNIPPPDAAAVLEVKVQLARVGLLPPMQKTPPPDTSASFSTNAQLVSFGLLPFAQ